MLIGCVIEHHIKNYFHAAIMCFSQQFPKVFHCPESWIDGLIVGNIITIINLRRSINRIKPYYCCAKVMNVVQVLNDTSQIANTIMVCVLKTFGINLIDDCFFPPIFFHCDSLLLFFSLSN